MCDTNSKQCERVLPSVALCTECGTRVSNVKKNKTEPTPEDILASLMSDLKNIDVKVDDTNSLKLSDDESENSNVNSELNPPDLLEFPEINKASLNKLNFKLNENQNSEDNHFQNEQTQHPNHSEDLNTLKTALYGFSQA